MTNSRPRWTLSASLIAVLALAACSSTPVASVAPAAIVPVAQAAMPAVGADTPAAAARSAPLAANVGPPGSALPAHRDPASAIARDRIVYFDFDSELLDAEDRALIDRHARYLLTVPALTFKIEGHADERGGSEYNLALG